MKNILFCLPGRSYTGRFLTCWTNLLVHCVKMGYKINVIQRYSCNIYYVRNMCLGTDVRRGEDQKPFDGKLDYDYMMWIDSDVLFTPEQFERLLSHDKDIVSGLYKMEDNTHYACVEHWNEKEFLKNGHFQFIKPSDIEYRQNKLIDVNYVGFGFILIKKGVFESLKYPHFKPNSYKIGNTVEFAMEDVSWCHNVKANGYQILVDPSIIVGHEKTMVLV